MIKLYSEKEKFNLNKFLLIFILNIFSIVAIAQNVSVSATGGTTTGSYATISAAFAAINNGTHQGTITLTIVSNTVEPGTPVSLLAPIGSAVYSSVTIVPSGNRIVTGIPNANRSTIELFGADNVTIDGDDPATAGTKNLSIETSTGNFISTSTIRIGSVSATNECNGINIRNCIIRGGRPNNVNITENFGILINGSSTTNALTAGVLNKNINIDSNDIFRCSYGIACVGTAGSPHSNISIFNNRIGVTTSTSDFVGRAGVLMFYASVSTGASKIEKNEIQVGIGPAASTGTAMESIGIWLSNGNQNLLVNKNYIHDCINNNAGMNNGGGTGLPITVISATDANVAGIQMTGTANTNVTISNNIIRDIISQKKQTALGNNANYGMFFAGFGSARIVHNTVGLMIPNTVGTATNTTTAALFLNVGTLTEYAHNIVVNKNQSTQAFCILAGAATMAAANADKNCYFYPNGVCGNLGGAPFGLDQWKAGTGKENGSFVEDVPFVSSSNLHVQAGKVTQLESNSPSSSIIQDFDDETRPGPAGSTNGTPTSPDIGADEFDGIKYVAPSILSVSHSPSAQYCTATSRTIIAVFNTFGNALDSVILEYTVNGGAKQYLKMNNTAANIYSRVIPAVSPANAIVTYRIFCVTPVKDSITSNFNSYNDYTASLALWPNIVSTPNQACVGSTVSLSYAFLPNPSGFNFPPSVTNPTTGYDIVNTQIGNINNTSTINSLSGSLGSALGTAGSYSNYRNMDSISTYPGRSYPISLTSTSTTGAGKCYFAGFVDFNGDGDFNDAGESVFRTIQVLNIGGRTEKFNIYIPPSARPGKTCLRVIVSSTLIANSFTNMLEGEVEDYTLVINPLNYTWMVGTTSIGTNNPLNYTLSAIPTSVYLDITDSAGCAPWSTNPISITASPTTMAVTLNAPTTVCYNSPQVISATVSGGCPPYTYSWSNSASTSSQTIILDTVALNLTVTVTDKNGTQMSASKTITPVNPKPLTIAMPFPTPICNRGTARLSITTSATDSGYWYLSSSASPYAYDSIGKSYTTPTISSNQTFYVSAFRSNIDSVGKLNLTGGVINNTYVLNTGLRLDIQEPVLIRSCDMYISGPATSTINIGLLDKYGTIIAQTGSFTPTYAASAAVPTKVNLNFLVTNVDTGYRLVLLDLVGLTAITRNTSGQTFPYPATKPIIVKGPFSIPIPNTGDYWYFYNIKCLKNMCVGEKKAVNVLVQEPRVPKIIQDLNYTQICKGDSLKLKIFSDTMPNRFVWTKNDVVLKDFSVSPPSDTFTDSVFRIGITGVNDTGLYRVRLFSTKTCTRDTFSREVRVSYYPEAKITTNLSSTNMCIGKNFTLQVSATDGYTYRWYRNNIRLDSSLNNSYSISNATIDSAGIYHVVVQDSNKCKSDTSLKINLKIFNDPVVTMHPLDSVICDGDRYIMKASVKNATTYQWYKDNGILNSFTKDSFVIYNSVLADSGMYRLVASSYPGCIDAVTNYGHLTVNPSPKILGFYPSNIKLCESQKLKLTSNTKDVSKVEWYKNGTFNGTTSDSFVLNSSSLATSGTYRFKAIGLNKCPSKFSDTTNVLVVKKPAFSSGSISNTNLCSGVEFKKGFPTTNIKYYQWYRNNIPVQGQKDSQLWIRFVDKSDTGTYYLKVTSDSVCPEISSNTFKIFITPAPKVLVQPIGDTACLGNDIQLDATVTNFSGLQWKKDGINVVGANSSLLNITNLSSTKEGKYWLEISGVSPCTTITSDTAYVKFRSGATNASASLVSVYNAVEQCTDQDGWTYYSPENDDTKYVLAVKKNGNSMVGKADIVVRPNAYQSISNSSLGYTAMVMMKRFWNYKVVSGDFINPIDVKFYYDDSEKIELENKKDEIQNLYTGQLVLENNAIRWFKSDSILFSNTLLNSISGNKFMFKTYDLPNFSEGIEHGIKYIAFQDVTNTGGGTGIYTFKGAPRVITGIQNANADFNSLISPNPNNGIFDLTTFSKSTGNLNVSIFNSLGQLVHTSILNLKTNKSENRFLLTNLASGFYQVLLTKDNYSTTIKLQIEK